MFSTGEIRYGEITRYEPKLRQGKIFDDAAGTELSFKCRHVYSPLLRSCLARTRRFDDHDVVLETKIKVSYRLIGSAGNEMAGMICLNQELAPDFDLACPLTGYVKWFGVKNRETGMLAGWIVPDCGGDTRGFSLPDVVDPVLASALRAGVGASSSQWKEDKLRVRFWLRRELNAPELKAFQIVWTDEEKRARRENRGERLSEEARRQWNLQRTKYIYPALESSEEYEEAAPLVKITPRQEQMLKQFYDEAVEITTSEPAIQRRIGEFWKYVRAGRAQMLREALNRESNIANTRVAKLCIAACDYLNHSYADALKGCLLTERYGLGAELAMQLERMDIAQRMMELAMDCSCDGDKIRFLARMALSTGNAQVFSEYFAQCIEMADYDPGLRELIEEFCICAAGLLEIRDINVEMMDPDELCECLMNRFSKDLPEVGAMIGALRQQEQEKIQEERDYCAALVEREEAMLLSTAAPAVPERSAEELLEEFRVQFKVEGVCRIPDPARDSRWIPMLDQLLSADVNPDAYRIPLLVRVCLDPAGSKAYICRYRDLIEEYLKPKRKRLDSDRRGRLALALLEFVEAQSEEARRAAHLKLMDQGRPGEEISLLNFLGKGR